MRKDAEQNAESVSWRTRKKESAEICVDICVDPLLIYMTFTNIKKILIIISLLAVVSIPAISFAIAPLVPPCPPLDATGGGGCGWNELMLLIKNIINFLLFYLALPAATLAFIYAGWLYLSSGGKDTQRTKAKNIFLNVVKGLVIAAAAWLIVSAILTGLGVKPEYILLEEVQQ